LRQNVTYAVILRSRSPRS